MSRQITSQRFDQVLFKLCSSIAAIGKCLAPLLPVASARILERVGCPKGDKWDEGPLAAGNKVIANGGCSLAFSASMRNKLTW